MEFNLVEFQKRSTEIKKNSVKLTKRGVVIFKEIIKEIINDSSSLPSRPGYIKCFYDRDKNVIAFTVHTINVENSFKLQEKSCSINLMSFFIRSGILWKPGLYEYVKKNINDQIYYVVKLDKK